MEKLSLAGDISCFSTRRDCRSVATLFPAPSHKSQSLIRRRPQAVDAGCTGGPEVNHPPSYKLSIRHELGRGEEEHPPRISRR